MIEFTHLETTKLPNKISRLLSEIESTRYNDFQRELVIDLRSLFGRLHEISVGNYYLQKDSFKESFHIDVPDKIAKKSSSFKWQLIGLVSFYNQYSRHKGKGKMSPLKLR